MTDQAENLRRLVRAHRDWKELTAVEPPVPRPVKTSGPVDSRKPPRNVGPALGLGGRTADRSTS